MGDTVLVTPIDEAKKFLINCFESVGTCRENAEIIADNLVEADYRGHYSHGLNRLHIYIDTILDKTVNANATPKVEKETVATALVNGNNGLGAVVGKFCMDLAIKKAKAAGIGFVTVHGSNHYGIAGMYTLQAIKEGCIGMTGTNTSPVLVPTRAKEANLGTNPLSLGAPGQNDDSFVLDMATTTVALGKLEIQKRKGGLLPRGWALNENGEMESDPERAIKALRLLPLGGDEASGGYKGYGLCSMVEILSGVLSGANTGPDIPIWNGDHGLVANLGQFFIAINPQVFAAGFETRLSNLLDVFRNLEPSDPDKPILVAGDPERKHMEQVRKQGGICYIEDQHSSNNIMAERLKVPPMISLKMKKII